AVGLTRDEALADDLVQETWIAAMRRPPRMDEPVRPWLDQVLRNLVRMRARGEGRRDRREDGATRLAETHAPSSDELVEKVELGRIIVEEVLALDEPIRATVLLRFYDGLSAAQIAAKQGIP